MLNHIAGIRLAVLASLSVLTVGVGAATGETNPGAVSSHPAAVTQQGLETSGVFGWD